MDRPFEAFVFGLHICMNTQDVEVVTFKMKPVLSPETVEKG